MPEADLRPPHSAYAHTKDLKPTTKFDTFSCQKRKVKSIARRSKFRLEQK